jgi:drug/metabolite transporter (DMT)-like permease
MAALADEETVTRNRWYFLLMGVCLTLFIASWAVIRLYSVVAAVVLSVVAMVIPPIAVMVANAGDESSRRQR